MRRHRVCVFHAPVTPPPAQHVPSTLLCYIVYPLACVAQGSTPAACQQSQCHKGRAFFLTKAYQDSLNYCSASPTLNDLIEGHVLVVLIGKYLSSLRKRDHVVAPQEGFEAQL